MIIKRFMNWLLSRSITPEQLHDQKKLILADLDYCFLTLLNRSKKMEITMADVQAEMEAQALIVAAEKAEVKAALDAQAVQIQALTDQIANLPVGGIATQEQVNNLMTAAKAVTAAIVAIHETAPAVPV